MIKEETEVKKDIEWLKKEIEEDIESWGGGNPDYFRGASDAYENVEDWLNQLDEPEVLSQKWIDDNSVYASSDGATEEYVHVDDLKELLVPKQELPVIPNYVAEFLIGKEDYMLYELFDDEWLYEEHDRVAKWLYDNDELTNKQREIDLVMARDRGYLVEEEQKYVVPLIKNLYLKQSESGDFGVGSTPSEMKYALTEQEIKDYDPRYWAFAKPIEELEE